MTSAMLVSLTAMTDCSIHWAGPLSVLIIALSFCGVQLGAGALVSHLDLASTHAAVITALSGTVGSSTYFILPAFRRILSASMQVDRLVIKHHLNWRIYAKTRKNIAKKDSVTVSGQCWLGPLLCGQCRRKPEWPPRTTPIGTFWRPFLVVTILNNHRLLVVTVHEIYLYGSTL